MQVVNRVRSCMFSPPLVLDECKQRALSLGLDTVLYKGRPTMLRIRYRNADGACTLILFTSGKARYMGKDEDAFQHLLHLESILVPSSRISSLREATRTVRLQLDIPPDFIPLHISDLPRGCIWEPELFPAIQFTQWDPLCINLFHSGVVMVLGRSTDSQLNEIRTVLTDFVHHNHNLFVQTVR